MEVAGPRLDKNGEWRNIREIILPIARENEVKVIVLLMFLARLFILYLMLDRSSERIQRSKQDKERKKLRRKV